MPRVAPQRIVFTYHKSGTSLFLHVMTKVCGRLGLTLANHYGLVDRLSSEPDVVLLPHSILRCPLDRPYRAIRVIRDPRDMWVSAYLYHLRCDELWCLNTDLDPTPPIEWPKVDYSVAHWPETWKRQYLERLDGRSYQQNLADRSQADGLAFELEGYTRCTFATMQEWSRNRADALFVRLEDVMADFDGAMARIFDYFGFTPAQIDAALDVARSEDVRRMDDSAIATRPQIHSRTISKWRTILSDAQVAAFENRYGGLIRELGYELTTKASACPANPGETAAINHSSACTTADCNASDVPPEPEIAHHAAPATDTTSDPAIALWVDGSAIGPTLSKDGVYTFIVPPGQRTVRLQSRFGSGTRNDPEHHHVEERLGVKVREIAIRSDAGVVVIAADDPRLTSGWYGPEQDGAKVWRWTNGSARLPWIGITGPAVVTIQCDALPRYKLISAEHRN